MRKLLIVAILSSSALLVGCENSDDTYMPPEVAKKILDNKEKNADKIRETVVECLKNSNNNRDVKYNDSNEVVETCTEYAQKLYGAYSQYYDSYLMKQAAKLGENK